MGQKMYFKHVFDSFGSARFSDGDLRSDFCGSETQLQNVSDIQQIFNIPSTITTH